MDLLDRLLGHDAWTTQQLVGLAAELSDEQLDRDFDIGHRSVRATLMHIIRNVEIWSALMAGEAIVDDRSAKMRSIPELTARLALAADKLARIARAVAQRNGWDELWLDVLDDPPREKTFGSAIAHVLTHSMHHRAQLLYMLRLLGARPLPEGDVFSWEQRPQ